MIVFSKHASFLIGQHVSKRTSLQCSLPPHLSSNLPCSRLTIPPISIVANITALVPINLWLTLAPINDSLTITCLFQSSISLTLSPQNSATTIVRPAIPSQRHFVPQFSSLRDIVLLYCTLTASLHSICLFFKSLRKHKGRFKTHHILSQTSMTMKRMDVRFVRPRSRYKRPEMLQRKGMWFWSHFWDNHHWDTLLNKYVKSM